MLPCHMIMKCAVRDTYAYSVFVSLSVFTIASAGVRFVMINQYIIRGEGGIRQKPLWYLYA